MKEIVLDTETTGMDPTEGHRIIEIGCVELFNHMPTGRTYHQYINPERDVPADAVAVHGITTESLKDKPVMSECVGGFLDFVQDATLVIHNAEFDMKFINYELKTLGFPSLPMKNVIDTLAIARKKFPGSPANLDALCRRFSIDNSNRTLHGALLDSELLAEVYLELIGGRQHGFSFDASKAASNKTQGSVMQGAIDTAQTQGSREIRPVRNLYTLQEEDQKAHQAMVSKLKDALWAQGEKTEA